MTLLALFGVAFAIGVVAIVAGVGGGVLFVPVVTAFFPIHVDFVRGAGLVVALIGAVAAAPRLMRAGLSHPRVAVPLALCGSIGSLIGARLGLIAPVDVVLAILGIFMLLIAIQTAVSAIRVAQRGGEHDAGDAPLKRLAGRWRLEGSYHDPATGDDVPWHAQRVGRSLGALVGVGGIGGLLGVGAGWANVPVLHSVMGLPVKVAAATSGLIIVANSTTAAWVYLRAGAIHPQVAVPAVIGMVIGTGVGARLLSHARPQIVRILVVVLLAATGVRTLIGVFG